MTKRLVNEIIVGLDIGTSKVLAVVAEVKENQEIEILGVGQHASKGLRKGVVASRAPGWRCSSWTPLAT